jgi:translocation and assembly module TamB
MRRLLHIFWVLPLLLLLPLGALYYLAYTESGLKLVATSLNRRLGPIDVQVRGVSGTLAQGVHVEQLIIDHRRVHIEIEDASGRLSILPLLWQTFRVPEVHAAKLLIHALARVDDRGHWDPHFLPPLMRIQAEHVTVHSWRLITTNDQVFDSTDASASGTVYPLRVRIYDGAFDYQGVRVRVSGDVLARQSIGLNGALHFDAQPSGQPAWTVNAHIDGNLSRLALGADISEPFAATFHGEITDLTSHWHWQGHGQLQRLELDAWGVGNALGNITGSLAMEGDHAGFSALGTLDPPGLHSGPLNAEFAGHIDGRILQIAHARLLRQGSGAIADTQGSVTVIPGGPLLDLHGSWTHFRWPLAATDAPVTSEHGTYTLQGQRSFRVAAQGDFQATSLPPMQVALQGLLGRDGLTADSGEVQTLGAHSQLSGDIQWSKSTQWSLRGHVSDLELGQLRPGTAGRLSFMLDSSGVGFGSAGQLAASISELSGSVLGQRAAGHARIARRGNDWQFSDVMLQLGATHIDLDGRLGSSLDLNYVLDAADLGLFRQGARGRLQARGSVRGDLHDPTLISVAQAHDIDWQGWHLDALDASIAFDPHGTGRADSTLQLRGLQRQGRRLEQLTLRLDGTTDHHELSLDAHAEGLNLALRGSGHYAAGTWQAQITSVELGDQAQLHMQLEAPTQLLLSADRLRLGQTCVHAEHARLCASAALDSGQRYVELQAIDMPMQSLTAGLTAKTDYDGTLSVMANATAHEQESWHGSMTAQLANAAIRKHFDNGRIETLNLGNGTVTAEINAHELTGNLALDAGSAGRIAGNLRARGEEADWRDWPLTGQLELETEALGYVTAFVSRLDRVGGRMTAQLSLAGTAAVPRVAGELKVIDGHLDAYQINLSLREINFSAKLADTTLTLEGAASAGPEGHVSVDGNLRWQQGLPYGDLHLRGSDLRVINIPEARVDASPDVALRMDGRRIELRGRVTLPYARIEPANLANAVLPSSDEVIVGQDVAPSDEQFHVFSDITLLLGERVTVNTQGLSGRLSGSISVTSDDTGINRGSGELNVEEGKYLAYGRNLDIQRGRLLFSNGLLSDPGLELRAVKKFPDITAGVNVRGTLRSPRMTFFSDPEVSQSQIVSLLLAGGSLESVQNSNGTDPATRANAGRSDALMQGGAILAQQLGGRYNIEAGVEQDMTNETSLVLGRYLSPRLYVSYGVGLAEAINTIKMRYTVGDHWTIKTEAGTQRSADLVFTIEK